MKTKISLRDRVAAKASRMQLSKGGDRESRRKDLERVVNTGVENIGSALIELRDEEHWKDAGYSSFHEYCKNVFKLSKTYLYDIIRGLENISKLPKEIRPKITNSSQALALSKIPEKRWIKAILAAEKNGGITAESLLLHGAKNITPKKTETKTSESVITDSPISESQQVTNEKPQNTPSEQDKTIVFDRVGTIVPYDAIPYWKHRQIVQDVLTQISKLKSKINESTEGVENLWSKHKQHGEEYLTRAYSYLSDALPHAVCLQCQGSFTFQPQGCSICGNTGFISEYRFNHYLPKELREIRMRSNQDCAKQHPESPLNKKPRS